jgi:hypothetical protein
MVRMVNGEWLMVRMVDGEWLTVHCLAINH